MYSVLDLPSRLRVQRISIRVFLWRSFLNNRPFGEAQRCGRGTVQAFLDCGDGSIDKFVNRVNDVVEESL